MKLLIQKRYLWVHTNRMYIIIFYAHSGIFKYNILRQKLIQSIVLLIVK